MTELERLRNIIRITSVNSGAVTYTAKGLTLSITQWSAYSGIKRLTIAARIRNGWSIKRAVSESATVGNNQHLRY